MKKESRFIAISLMAFTFHFVLDDAYFKVIRKYIFDQIDQFGISHILAYFIVGIPVFFGVILLHGKNRFFYGLGFDRSFWEGFIFTLLCTLPSFIGFSLLFEYDSDYSLNAFLITVVAASFFEELYFRAFLFGQLYRFTRFGFIPAVIIGAILFGMIHLYQGETLMEALGIFAITFLGGVLFAWLYAEWNFNIWIPIFLHFFMNLAWGVFSVSDTVLGSVYANLFRFGTVFLAIGLTLFYKRRRGIGLEVRKGSILFRKSN